ncbi:exported protein of unknown function [Xenorhabdus poinarii G6]|uniref:Uncharacterized protein n=1 Tax=Xenorhabdus poinarii G6 TaxID=1354304 RepID=A0A068R122_9GAMM|nr:hypothetical protein [Xenorhabdus poinarii]CDG19765.1 exported protein of unknown function [Xenorhabdus poinarii G6]
MYKKILNSLTFTMLLVTLVTSANSPTLPEKKTIIEVSDREMDNVKKEKNVAHVSTKAELISAVADQTIRKILVYESLYDVPNLSLKPGQSLIGTGPNLFIDFSKDIDGLQLSENNTISNITLKVTPTKRAIYNTYNILSFGKFELEDIKTIGQVQIVAKDKLIQGALKINNLHVIFSDTTATPERPSTGIGSKATSNIDILQGAVTLLNLQQSKNSIITAEIRGLTIGLAEQPVYGSGLLISGGKGNIYTHSGDTLGGQVKVSVVETGDVFNDSKIPAGTDNLISGSVFIAYANAEQVINRGRTISYGTNGLGLDNWGRVKNWTSIGPVETFGDSGMGVVNFGVLNYLSVASIQTHGNGARAFNVLTGTVDNAYFGSLKTYGNGATAILISQPIGRLSVNSNIETFGASANSLTAGILDKQPSAALRMLSGSAKEIFIGGNMVTRGEGSGAIELQDATLERLVVQGKIQASGKNSNALKVVNSNLPLINLDLKSAFDSAIFLSRAHIVALSGVKASGIQGDLVVEQDSSIVTRSQSTEALSYSFGNHFNISGADKLTIENNVFVDAAD